MRKLIFYTSVPLFASASISHDLIDPEGRIHTQNVGSPDLCMKNHRDSKVLALAKCDSSDPLFRWSSNLDTDGFHHIKSDASNECWQVDKINQAGSKLRLETCDSSNAKQKFDFENGLIYHHTGNGKHCMSLSRSGRRLKMQKCKINRFGLISAATSDDNNDSTDDDDSSDQDNEDPVPKVAKNELEAYVWNRDPNFAWEIIGDVNPLGKKDGLAAYYWVKLTSQKHLNETYVTKGSLWRHNVLVCVGESKSTTFDEAAVLFTRPDGGHDSRQLFPSSQPLNDSIIWDLTGSDFDHYCNIAKRLGVVSVVMDQTPPYTEWWFQDNTGMDGEDQQVSGTSAFFNAGAPIEASMEFGEVKAMIAAMDMTDELMAQENLRAAELTKWGTVGESKRGWAATMHAAVEDRVVALFPPVSNIAMDLATVFMDSFKGWGGFSFAVTPYYASGHMHHLLSGSPNAQKFDNNFNLNKHYIDRLSSIPIHFNLGTADFFMPPDGMLSWWNDKWASSQKLTSTMMANAGHVTQIDTGFTAELSHTYDAMHVNFEAAINGDQLPYVDWSFTYSAQNDSVNVCLVRPTTGTAKIYRGVADNGRDFRQLKFDFSVMNIAPQNIGNIQEIGSCTLADPNAPAASMLICDMVDENVKVVVNADGCYEFVDTNALADGEYAMMYFSMAWDTPYASDVEGVNYQMVQSSATLIRPEGRPFEDIGCPGDACHVV